jgi:hypothetical protein
MTNMLERVLGDISIEYQLPLASCWTKQSMHVDSSRKRILAQRSSDQLWSPELGAKKLETRKIAPWLAIVHAWQPAVSQPYVQRFASPRYVRPEDGLLHRSCSTPGGMR